jgi:hypothetical protein
MSSATSINSTKGSFRLKAEATKLDATKPQGTGPESTEPDVADSGFRPWHFFVLTSLAASTVAVVMSRQSAPEHLILISFTIGAAGVAGAAFYRMVAPLALRDVSLFRERPSERALATLEREKALVLRSIKELEFDRAMGKVSQKDFDEMAGRLRARAIMLMKQVDAGGAGYRELIERELQVRLNSRTAGSTHPVTPPEGGATVVPACRSCGTNNDHDAAFCKRCGTSLAEVIR